MKRVLLIFSYYLHINILIKNIKFFKNPIVFEVICIVEKIYQEVTGVVPTRGFKKLDMALKELYDFLN